MEKYDFENLNGVQWAHLLCEHPEFADKCDWANLKAKIGNFFCQSSRNLQNIA